MRNVRSLVGMALIAGCLPGCGGDELLDKVERTEEQWASVRPNRYEIVVEEHCYCDMLTTHTTVAGNQATAVRVETGEQAAPIGVEALFRSMRGYLKEDYAEAEAEFDSELHYPTSFWVDPDQRMADEEWGFTVKCFAAGEAHCE